MRSRLVLVVVALSLAFVVLAAATERISDVDVGWIVAAGRRTLAMHAAPTTNGFSYVAPGNPWIMHEWLLGPIYALGVRAVGLGFLAIAAALATLGLGWLVVARSFAVLKHPVVAGIWATVLFVVGFDRLKSARPIAWSLVLACALAVVVFRTRLARREIVGAMLLTLLWTNVHGSFPLALVIVAAAAVDAVSRRGHVIALAVGAVATLVNPYGPRLHALVVAYALGRGSIGAVHERVLEFAPIWRAGYHDVVSPLEIGVVLVVAVIAIDALRRSSTRGAAGLALLLCVGALVQARNAGLAILLGSLLVQSHVASRLGADDALARLRVARSGFARPWLLVVPAAVAGVVALVATITTRAADDWISPSIGGAPFARLARQLPDDAKTFVPFRSGGLLLYLAGERGITTFYDSRNDCYPEAIVRVALALKDGELPAEGLAPLLAHHGTEWAIVPRAAYVRATPGDPRWAPLALLEPALVGWTAAATDEGWTLLRRDVPARHP